MTIFSRRDFLKLSGFGLAGLIAPPLNFDFNDLFEGQQGRVTARIILAHQEPSTKAKKTKLYLRDGIFNITNTAISDDDDSHNRIWYQAGDDGYVHSSDIQPVRTIFNIPVNEIPEEGLLAEISVPYTDAYREPDKDSKVAYRMYYETTHWIKGVTTDEHGQVWYQILDDKWDKYYYALGEHIRILSDDELAPISPDVPNDNKKIVVRLAEQIVIAYENNRTAFVAPVSSGAVLRAGTYTTPSGEFITFYKRPSRHMAAGDIAASGFDLPGVPWVQYITESGISFHGTFWHNDFGRPRSHGCVNLSCSAAKWLFRWTSPQVPSNKEFSSGIIGTNVEII